MAEYKAYTWSSVEIIQRLIARFDLQEYPIALDKAMLLPHQIIPVTQVDDLLKVTKLYVDTTSITGNATITPFTVPSDKRWRVLYFRVALSTGTYTVGSINVGDGTNVCLIDTTTGTNVLFEPTSEVWLETGWDLNYEVSGYSVTGNCNATLYCIESDAY